MIRNFTGIALGALALGLSQPHGHADYTQTSGGVQTTLSKLADLPFTIDQGNTGSGISATRSDLVQIGDELWFTSGAGGNNLVGSISTYNIQTGALTVRYSFGIGDTIFDIKKDGYLPQSGLLAGTGSYSGKFFYSTRYGGMAWDGGPNGTSNNGGAVGIFDPATGKTEVLWSGSSNPNPNQVYSTPVYQENSSGQFLYFLTNGGGAGGPTNNFGTIQKINLATKTTTQVASLYGTPYFTGTPPADTTGGRQPQGGLLQVGSKIYFGTPSGGTQLPPVPPATNPTPSAGFGTFQVIDTTNDSVSVLAHNIDSGIYNTPIYDADREALYAVTLSKGIYKWDLNTGLGEILANSVGVGNTFADPILFGDSIFYATQGSSATNAGFIYRYSLELEQLFQIYNLNNLGYGITSGGSGSLSLVNENGLDVLYFVTGSGGANTAGTVLRLEVTAVPEPSAWALLSLAIVGLGLVRFRAARR